MADPIITKIGDVSAYLDAVAHGFEGTRAEFGELLANSANYAQSAESAASAAIASAATATTKAGEATTAATAAQTAKTQTEAAASQALTDIGTAESGAISAIQTEGATQTANATAQAQAAATSAITASTKASEASASATTATTKATEAAASATSAANAASAAQGVLESIPEDYSDLSEDVDQLKADLADVTNHAVKSAEQLISDKRTVDKVPYKYRASASGKSDRAYDMIVGGTVCFNQLCNSSSVATVSGRKYLTKVSGAWSIVSGTGSAITGLTSGTDMVMDLTTMFGTAIADHIYSLEQANSGAGVALFRQLFPNEYYTYNAGSLISVEGLSAKEVVGFNLFDDEAEFGRISTSTGEPQTGSGIRSKNFIPIIPSETYYFTRGAYQNSNASIIMYYDSDKNYMSWENLAAVSKEFVPPANARFIKCQVQTAQDVTTYNHDICINLSDPLKNGQYEPYHKNVYPLDSTLTLRGVPVLKDGKVEFDGDIYASDGTVTRKYAERAYQSGDESLANAITDGTNTVYKLSAETTETAIPYASPQIVAPYGTEEYISETVCPVGHITEYPDNLRAKIDGLPWDLSMIAPVETAYKATRNYVTGNLLIVDNTLYKVTANIANGGTITPNTNVVATTLSEVIATLS